MTSFVCLFIYLADYDSVATSTEEIVIVEKSKKTSELNELID